jgi:hypothetical protein
MKLGTQKRKRVLKTGNGALNRERVLENGNGYSKTETGRDKVKTRVTIKRKRVHNICAIRTS